MIRGIAAAGLEQVLVLTEERPTATEVIDFPPFRTRPPWLGGDLQTLRNLVVRRYADLSDWPARRLELALGDGSGDRLSVALHRPADGQEGPLAVLIHGLTGCEDSRHVRASARHLLQNGYSVARMNLRGAGPSRPLCRSQYDAGSSADLRDALRSLRDQDPGTMQRGLFLVGYSLGASMLLKFLAEHGAELHALAGASVSAPIDLAAAQRRLMMPRNALYQRYLLTRMKQNALAGGAEGREDFKNAVSAVRTIYQFDDKVVAPAAGYAGAADYYAQCSALGFLAAIPVPTLMIHALDDPWIPATAYLEYDWHAAPRLLPLLSKSGGHVGFHGRGGVVAWHDRCIVEFFEGRA